MLGGCGQIRTDYLALMRRLLIRMSFAAVGEGGGHRTRFIRLWRPTFYQSEVHPQFQRTNKTPTWVGVWCSIEMHSDPQDTTPQMTRFAVILTMSRFDVLSIASIPFTTSSGASGRTRTCVHFVRSEGHQSALARTLKSLVGELRIELSPRAPKARMQRNTPFPDGASPAS